MTISSFVKVYAHFEYTGKGWWLFHSEFSLALLYRNGVLFIQGRARRKLKDIRFLLWYRQLRFKMWHWAGYPTDNLWYEVKYLIF